MSLKFAIFCLLFTTISSNSSFEWEKFKRDYKKQYAHAAEEAERKKIFLENVIRIKEHQQTHPDAKFTIGINHLADRRIEELTSNSQLFFNTDSAANEKSIQPKLNLPDRWDWRDKDVVTPVYNQGQTGKDWAVAAVEVIESYYAIQHKELVRGDFKQISDCCLNSSEVFECINRLNGGLCRANENNPACEQNTCQPFARFNKIKRLTTRNESTMLEWIQGSPLFVSIDDRQAAFQFYTTGIYRSPTCSKDISDHPLQLVGYGIENKEPFWICKNSWGVNWGDQGYVKIERNTNMCGIASFAMQIEYESNDAMRLFTIKHLCLVFFCLVFRLT